MNSCVPCYGDHQVDGIIHGDDISDQGRVNFESAKETFSNSRDES